MISLRTYQQKAVEEVGKWLEEVSKAGPNGNYQRRGLLEAPTGAGKTVIAGKIVEKYCQDKVVLWLSPGKGDLEEQSYASVNNLLEGTNIDVVRLTPEYLTSNERSGPGTLIITNWEELNNKNKRLIRKSESHSGLMQHLADTVASDIELVLFDDEGHFGSGKVMKERDTAVKRFLDDVQVALGFAPIRLSASATPKWNPEPAAVDEKTQIKVQVSTLDVITAGMITKEFVINSGIEEMLSSLTDEELANSTGEAIILRGAYAKHLQLCEEYKVINSPVVPLTVVQIPNNTCNNRSGDDYLKMVKEFYSQYGISVDNGNMAIWMNGEEKNQKAIDSINSFYSPIKILVCKQTISTGWDCPRAQILVGFRVLKNSIFSVQTLGRFVRMPERKHYNDPNRPDLDKAHIFTNLPANFSLPNNTGVPPVRVSLKRRFSATAIPGSQAVKVASGKTLNSSFLRKGLKNSSAGLLEKEIAENLLEASLTVEKDFLGEQALKTEELSNISFKGLIKTKVGMSDVEKEMVFKETINQWVAGLDEANNAAERVKKILYNWVRNILETAHKLESEKPESANRVELKTLSPSSVPATAQVLIVASPWREQISTLFNNIINDWREQNKLNQTATKEDFSWSPPSQLSCDKKKAVEVGYGGDEAANRYLYADSDGIPQYLGELSRPEKEFAGIITGYCYKGLVDWWWKNGEAAGSQNDYVYHSITYITNGGILKTTYPDFIIRFIDGLILVLEVKEPDMENGIDPEARRKAAALHNWQQGNVIAGVVYKQKGSNVWQLAISEDKTEDRPLNTVLFDQTGKRASSAANAVLV